MEKLGIRQKQEWKTSLDDHWVRTGCEGLWDAVLIAFREYRDAPPAAQVQMIQERTKISPLPSEQWVGSFYQDLHNQYMDREEDKTRSMFFSLLPFKLISAEIFPYIQKYIQENQDASVNQVCQEIIEKCTLLAEYRQKKKNLSIPETEGCVSSLVSDFLSRVLRNIQLFSYDTIQQAMLRMEHQLIILSPTEKVLFDSKHWGDGVEGGDYQDVVIVLAHPDGGYDSVGRVSHTKDGHQKISRLFHYDDDVVASLRHKEQ